MSWQLQLRLTKQGGRAERQVFCAFSRVVTTGVLGSILTWVMLGAKQTLETTSQHFVNKCKILMPCTFTPSDRRTVTGSLFL